MVMENSLYFPMASVFEPPLYPGMLVYAGAKTVTVLLLVHSFCLVQTSCPFSLVSQMIGTWISNLKTLSTALEFVCASHLCPSVSRSSFLRDTHAKGKWARSPVASSSGYKAQCTTTALKSRGSVPLQVQTLPWSEMKSTGFPQLRRTLGAVLIGGVLGALWVSFLRLALLAHTSLLVSLSGIVSTQAIIYFKTYSGDRTMFRIAVCPVPIPMVISRLELMCLWLGWWDMVGGIPRQRLSWLTRYCQDAWLASYVNGPGSELDVPHWAFRPRSCLGLHNLVRLYR